jgi:NTP pyrophosphatase (non-canonical NTP hydrolase)
MVTKDSEESMGFLESVGPLGFDDLALANRNRCGASFHPLVDWSPTDWATAAAGELGEALNKIKKARRTDYRNLAEERTEIGYELADAVIYIDLLCSRLDIDLGEAVRAKFNIVSERVGSEIRL